MKPSRIFLLQLGADINTSRSSYEPASILQELRRRNYEAMQCLIDSRHRYTIENWDGTELYFGSDRPSGFGGKDIYVIRRPRIRAAR